MWWFNQWNNVLAESESWFGKAVVPNEEITKIVEDAMVRLFNDQTTPEECYETIKPKIEEICKICPRQDGKEFE